MKFMTYVAGVNLDRYAENIERQRRLRDRRDSSAIEPPGDTAKTKPESNAIKPATSITVEGSLKAPEPAAKPPKKSKNSTSTKCKRRGSVTVESDSDADISASISIKGSSKSCGSKSVRFQDEEEGPKSILKKTSGYGSSDYGCGCTGERKKDGSQDSCVQGPTSNKRNVSKKDRGFDNKTSEGLFCSCNTTTTPNKFPSHTRDNRQPQKHAQKYSDFIRGHNPNMSRLIHQSRAEVIIREDVVETPTDPRPNAFFDSRTGTLRVYHGPVYGNPFSTLVPIQASQFPIGANAHQPYGVATSGIGGAINGGVAYQQPGAVAAAAANSPQPPASQEPASPGSAHSSTTAKGNHNNGSGGAQGNNNQTPWSGDGWGDESNDNKDSWNTSNDDGNKDDNYNSGDAWGSSNDNNNNNSSNGNSGGGWGSTNTDNNSAWGNPNPNSGSKANNSNNSSSWGNPSAGQSTQKTTSNDNSGWKGTGNETTVSAGSWGDDGGKKDDTPAWGDQSAAQSWGGGGGGDGGGESGW